MRAAILVLAFACATGTLAREGPIVLGGERIHLGDDLSVQFTSSQLRRSQAVTRAAFVRWAATAQGRRILTALAQNNHKIVVIEDPEEEGAGRAPQPGIATLLAANDPAQAKVYEIILNPAPVAIPKGMTPLPNQPATAEDFVALAWAAELLHIHFYARGIPLPHHNRPDFQEAWLEIATQLGFPTSEHGEEDEGEWRSSRQRVRVIGARRR